MMDTKNNEQGSVEQHRAFEAWFATIHKDAAYSNIFRRVVDDIRYESMEVEYAWLTWSRPMEQGSVDLSGLTRYAIGETGRLTEDQRGGLLLLGDVQALLATKAAQPAAGQVQEKDWRHAINEWADVACNGLDWLRNLKDGISDPAKAIENMERCIAHARSVSDALATTVPPLPAAEQPGDKLPKWIDALKGKDPTIDGLIEYIIELNACFDAHLARQAQAGAVGTAAPAYEHDLLDIVRSFCSAAQRLTELTPEQRKNYPSPLSPMSPLFQAASAACVERGYTEWGLAIEGVEYPVATSVLGSAPQAAPVAPDLHNAIMNLQIPVDPKIPADAGVMLAYKMGHRDARHAAAELVAGIEAQGSAQAAQAEE